MRRRIFIAAISAVLLMAPAGALEYGGILDNGTTLKAYANNWQRPGISDTATLTANLRQPFTEDGTFYLAAEGFFRYSFSATLGSSATPRNQLVLDLSLLKLSYTARLGSGSALTVSGGRFVTADVTQRILAQAVDGLQAQIRLPRVSIQATAAYTGLLNAKTTSMLSASGTAFATSTSKILYELAAPYVIAEAAVSFPYLVWNQSLTVEALGAFGVGSEAESGNRMYATLLLNGPLAPFLFYKASTTFGTADFSTLTNLSALELTCYPGFKSSELSLGVAYASGGTGDIVSPFTGITSVAAVQSSAVQGWTSLLKAGLSGSLKPLDTLYVSAGVDAVFACSTEFGYAGILVAAGTRYQPFSDVQVSLNASSYLAKDTAKSATTITLKATISF